VSRAKYQPSFGAGGRAIALSLRSMRMMSAMSRVPGEPAKPLATFLADGGYHRDVPLT
jgi:hypothetical protein